jgi:ABC-2 type transport system ATP-binding protein
MTDVFAATVTAHHHGARIGLVLIVLILLGGLGYGGFRLWERRRARPLPDDYGTARPSGYPAAPSPPPGHASPPLPRAGAAGSAWPPPPGPAAPGPAAPDPAAPDLAAGERPPPPPSMQPPPPPGATGSPSFVAPGAGTPRRNAYPAGASVASNGHWAVETHGLTKRFGPTVAVDDVELLVPRGCAFGYLGPNGAGKTTLIRTLLGLTHADAGTMSLLGVPVPSRRDEALSRVGAIVDEPRFHAHLTGRENLALLAAARGGGSGARIAPSLARVGLTERADHKVGSYSMGMRQRLGVAACLLADPELLILDEPMNGLDPGGMQEMRAMIHSLVAEGRTVMLSSHLLDEVERTCDAVAIVDRGRVVRQGPIDELVRGGSGAVVRVDCSEPERAAGLLTTAGIVSSATATESGLTVSLPTGASREVVAEVVRRLVAGGISVYELQEVRATLEDWFLSVTSRLGAPA